MAKEDGLSKDILEAIQRTLPEATVGVLREELSELTRLRGVDQKYQDRTKEVGALELKLREKEKEISDFRKRENDLLLREKKVEDSEIRLELTLVKEQLKAVSESRTEIQKLAETVFRNKTIVETFNRLGEMPYWDQGKIVGMQKGPGTETKTTSEI